MSYNKGPTGSAGSAHETDPLPFQLESSYIYNPFVRSKPTAEPSYKRSKSSSKLPTQLTRSPSLKRLQRRNRRVTASPPTLNTNIPMGGDFSEAEFSFTEETPINSPFSDGSLSSSGSIRSGGVDSDLESLPDTDESTPNTSPMYNSNRKSSFPFFRSNNNISSYFEREHAEYQEQQQQQPQQPQQPSIFEIPEIVHKIVEFADLQFTVVPQEGATIRRKPLSYNHAMLIYGNKEDAEAAMKDQRRSASAASAASSAAGAMEIDQLPGSGSKGVLYTCLLVNKLFHQVTTEFINKKFFFSSEVNFMKYIQQNRPAAAAAAAAAATASTSALALASASASTCVPAFASTSGGRAKTRPSMLVLHKLFSVKSETVDMLKHSLSYQNLEWIEFFMCPKLLPTPQMFDEGNGHKIKKFIVTGSKVLDDTFLIQLSKRCRNLEVLDIRACELVSDAGIYSIGKYCKNLRAINFGRKHRGHLVTDNSVSNLVKNNRRLNTIGLAGCHITDKVLWDVAIHCNKHVERLSLNNCALLTNQSVPLILYSNYLPNLSVLELRFVDKLTNFVPIIEFKRRQEFRGIPMLIEVCEQLCEKMNQQEIQMDKAISRLIFKDISEFVNDTDNDTDISHLSLINERRSRGLAQLA